MDATLIDMATQVRGKTLYLLTHVGEDEARLSVAGLHNTILWHGGHAMVVIEQLCLVDPFGMEPSYPSGWFEMFGWNSKPSEVKVWPSLSEVVAALSEQRERLVAKLSSIDAATLDEPIGEPPHRSPRRSIIVHGLHDEACHQGEIYLLMKLLRRGAR
jgi:hypothetical protein